MSLIAVVVATYRQTHTSDKLSGCFPSYALTQLLKITSLMCPPTSPSHLAPPGLVAGVKLAQHADSAQLLKLGFV